MMYCNLCLSFCETVPLKWLLVVKRFVCVPDNSPGIWLANMIGEYTVRIIQYGLVSVALGCISGGGG